MDNELKKTGYSMRTVIWGVSSLLFVLASSASMILGTNLYALYWLRDINIKNVSQGTINVVSFSMFGAIALTVAVLIISVMKCGRKADNGEVHLNWFDKIFSEVQIIFGVIAGAAFVGALYLQYLAVVNSTWFTPSIGISKIELQNFLNSNDYPLYYNDSMVNIISWPVLVFLAVLLTTAVFAFELLIIQSIAKKLKNHCFWRRTIIGTIVHHVNKYAKGNDKIFAKVMIILIVGTLVAATWVGTAAVILLIVIMVPKYLKKYQDIKDGVDEIKNGNLDYKIPIEGDSELERLAAGINEIGEAQSVAIQNELKNQKLKTDLISNVSHDLKTPLTSMVSYVDLLKKEGLDSKNAPEYLRIIDEKTNRLQKLTEDLFEAAKASSGDIPVNLDKIEMVSIANQALAELEENLAVNDIQVIFTPKTDNAYVMADGQLLWRVIENLLTNVSKYALPHSRAYVDIVDEDIRLKLIVKNMSKDQLNIDADELMERFKRGDESRNTEGSGLGLAIAKDLTNLMGGDFKLYVDGDLFKAIVELDKA